MERWNARLSCQKRGRSGQGNGGLRRLSSAEADPRSWWGHSNTADSKAVDDRGGAAASLAAQSSRYPGISFPRSRPVTERLSAEWPRGIDEGVAMTTAVEGMGSEPNGGSHVPERSWEME